MIKHIVLWKIDSGKSQEVRRKTIEEFRQKVEYLKTIIPEILEATVGENLAPGDEYHVCIDSRFESMETLQIYIDHPEHLKVREFLNTHAYAKAIFDYEI